MKDTPSIVFPLKIQAIRSKGQTPKLYVYFPQALSAAIGLEAGEQVQWELLDRGEVHLIRLKTAKAKARKHSRTIRKS